MAGGWWVSEQAAAGHSDLLVETGRPGRPGSKEDVLHYCINS